MALELNTVTLTETDKKKCDEALRNWTELNKVLEKANLGAVQKLLKRELTTKCRLTIVQRLTARYGVLEQQVNEREVAEALARFYKEHKP